MSKSLSSQDRTKENKKDHITSDTIIVTRSKMRRRSISGDKEVILPN